MLWAAYTLDIFYMLSTILTCFQPGQHLCFWLWPCQDPCWPFRSWPGTSDVCNVPVRLLICLCHERTCIAGLWQHLCPSCGSADSQIVLGPGITKITDCYRKAHKTVKMVWTNIHPFKWTCIEVIGGFSPGRLPLAPQSVSFFQMCHSAWWGTPQGWIKMLEPWNISWRMGITRNWTWSFQGWQCQGDKQRA